ncbi:uncharacterized protein LOC124168212 [Ischnura elegans]|uniref:uncharacterized protein LOC124168212 n=1 Tax=Ischnura elegans TaxID=197161 RepID=UPI001ED8B43F|nr:uncharacterized protein LOC124168212 [Ischnura elegans]
MAPFPCNNIDWDDYKPYKYLEEDTLDSLDDLLCKDIFGQGQDQRSTRTEDPLELNQFCEGPNSHLESPQFPSEISAINHEAERGTRALYYEVRRSEVTRCITSEGEEEVSVTHTVEQTWRWQEELGVACPCCYSGNNNCESPSTPFDTSGATCGFLQHQQVPRQQRVSRDMGHYPGDGPVGDLSIIDEGDFGISNVHYNSQVRRDTCINGGYGVQRLNSKLTDDDVIFLDKVIKTLKDQENYCEDKCDSATDQNDNDCVIVLS